MYNNFNGMYQPMMQSPQQQEVLKVTGRNGANALNLAPNSSVLALDTSAPIVWLVTTDGAAYKTCTPYEIKPYEEISTDSLEKRISRLEELIQGVITNGQQESNTSGDSPSNSYGYTVVNRASD